MEDRDPEKYAGWREDFIEAYLKTGDMAKAAAATPYSYSSIYSFQNPQSKAYDAEFGEMFATARKQLIAGLEGILHQSINEEEDPKKRFDMSMRLLEKVHRVQYGKAVDIRHSGRVEHEHSALPPREQRLLELAEEQKRYMLVGDTVEVDEEPEECEFEVEEAEIVD